MTDDDKRIIAKIAATLLAAAPDSIADQALRSAGHQTEAACEWAKEILETAIILNTDVRDADHPF